MENPTSFDLNFAIKRWRSALAQSPAMLGEDLDELESHLRDATGDLKKRGLSEEEAALIAARRLGWAETLVREFGKINASVVWRDRALWMLFMTVGWDLSTMTSSAFTYVGSMIEPNGISLGWFAVAARVLTLGLVVALFWQLTTGKLARWNSSSTRLRQHPVSGAVILLGGILLIKLLSFYFDQLSIRNLGPQALGQTYMVTQWFNLVSPVLAAIVMIVLFSKLISGRVKSTGSLRATAWILVPLFALSLGVPSVRAQASSKPAISSNTASSNQTAPATLDTTMKLWTAGNKDKAVAEFLAVDFSRRPLFPSGSVMNYSEAQFIALPQTARDKLSKQLDDVVHVFKEISGHIKTARKAAIDAGDKTRATLCTTKLQQCGEAFDQPGSLELLKLVGKALKRMSTEASGTPK